MQLTITIEKGIQDPFKNAIVALLHIQVVVLLMSH